MPLYAILVREYFGAKIMGTAFGMVAMVSTLGMAIGPWAGGWLFDTFGSYFWLYIGSFGIGLGAVAIAFTFRPPERQPVATGCCWRGVNRLSLRGAERRGNPIELRAHSVMGIASSLCSSQ